MKKVYVSLVLTIFCIVAAVYSRGAMDNTEVEYTEVEVTVVSSETKERTVKTGSSRSTITSYEIVVSYMGQNYDLENAHNSYSYLKGATVKAYLANGKMYANVEGVRNSTPAAIVYFSTLIGSFVLFMVTICWWANEVQRKHRERKRNS